MEFINGLAVHGQVYADIVDGIAVLPLCEMFSRPPDQIRIFLIFIVQYPIGWFMHYCVHGAVLRHLFTITIGVLMQMWLYGFAIGHVALMSGVAYAMMILMPRDKSAPAVMFWVLGYLSYTHLMSIWYNFGGYEMEISTYTMLLVCKLSALAYCYQDGATDPAKLTQY